jgi:hypothetical protein
MMNQADATKFNAATQGRANVAGVQGPSAMDFGLFLDKHARENFGEFAQAIGSAKGMMM